MKITLHKGLIKLTCFVLLAITILGSHTAPVIALSDAQIKALQSGVYYFNTEEDKVMSSCGISSTSDDTPTGSGSVYLVGDSIGTQIQTKLNSTLSANGWSFKANVANGRTLPQGITAVNQDQDFVKTAKAVVVQLGTNTSEFSPTTVGQMISAIRSLAPNATIYWVDTAVVGRPSYTPSLNNINSIIYAQSTQQNFQVISWSKKVFGDSTDPKSMNPNAPDTTGLIRQSDEFVHLTSQGETVMSELIASAITSETSNTGANNCIGTGSPLTGNDNAEKIWIFLICKDLTPPQVAGIMGNLKAESSYNPKRVEGGHMQGSKWVNSPPYQFPAEMDTIPPNVGPQGQPGYGIAQWTSPGRKKGLADKANVIGKPASDLGVQLEFMFEEATNRGDMTKLKLSNSASDAAFTWHKYYEVSSDGPERIQNRIKFANDIMIQYGSTSGGSCNG